VKTKRTRRLNVCLGPLLALALLPAAGCRSVANLTSHWTQDPPDLTGRASDFEAQGAWLSASDDVAVWVGNDDRFLYLRFNPDVRQRRQVATRTTLSLRFGDGSGACGYDFTHLDFPAGDTPRGRPEGEPSAPPPTPADAGRIVVVRGGMRGESLPADGSRGPRVVFSDKWGDYTYEWRIPLGDPPGIGVPPAGELTMTWRWRTEPLRPARRPPERGDRSGPQPGVGERQAGMGGGLPPGAIRPQSSHRASREIQLRLRLAGRS